MVGEDLTASQKFGYAVLCAGLVLFAGLMSGLTLGLLSLDRVELEVLVRSGTPLQKKQAASVVPLVKHGHRLLVTLLLMNAAAMETLPIFLDKLLDPVGAILISVTAVLIFGEIVPQAICQRFGLAVGHKLRWLVYGLIVVASPVSIPMAKLLDYVLGVEEGGGLFRRAQLKALVDIHGSLAHGGHGGELTADETTIISGALDMSHKNVAAVMTPLERVRGVAVDTPLTWSALREILACGHSRLPVHAPGDPTAIVGLLLVKELFAAVTLDDLVAAEGGVQDGEARSHQGANGDAAMRPPPPPPRRTRTIVDAIRLRPIPRMNKETPLYTALNYFQTGRSHMAVVTAGATVLYLEPNAAPSWSSGGGGVTAARDSGLAAAAAGAPTTMEGPPRLTRSRSGGSAALLSLGEASPPVVPAHAARRSLDASAAEPTRNKAPLILDKHTPPLELAPATGVIGILTLEDVLEELLQEEILDETDRAEGDEHVAAAENDATLHGHLSAPPALAEPPAGGAEPLPPTPTPRRSGSGWRGEGGDADEGTALLELHSVHAVP